MPAHFAQLLDDVVDKPPMRRDARASTLVKPKGIDVEGDFDSKYLRFPDTLKNLDFMRFLVTIEKRR
jgi:hypothetical protein